MTGAILAFACGVLALQVQPSLPPAWSAWLLPACVLAAWRSPKPVVLLLCLAIGFLCAAGRAQWRMDERLAPELEGRDLEVVGVVSSLPAIGERSVRFEFEVESAAQLPEIRLPRTLLLSWYRSPLYAEERPAVIEDASQVHPGERWMFTVRLRRPHGTLNPHGFDYEAWLLERGIGATGYVRPRGEPRRLGMRNSALDRVEQAREAVRERFRAALGDSPAAGILVALAVGDQRSIPAEQWKLFNRTGVTHLMSISGLHVTLVSGLAAWLAAFGWRRSSRLCLALPSRQAAALAAILAAFAYTLLAGFAVPAQRTFYMVTVVALALWAGRISSSSRVLALALGAVLLADPWAVLSPGFWLSFGAVALIFFGAAGWTSRPTRVAQWVGTQWAVTVGLAPAALFLFSQVSVVGPLANAIAIPVVSAVVTPLALLAALVPLELPLMAAEWLTRWLLVFLEWCAALPAAVWQQHTPPLWAVVLAVAGTLWLLLPRGFPSRWAGLALMLPVFTLPPQTPPQGEAWVTTLDVGQGLAVVVRTASRTLLYDAGPMLGTDSDAGERIVVPYLNASGVARIDAMVVTHNDLDHTGGAISVLDSFEVGDFRSSLQAGHPVLSFAPGSQPCRAGTAWEWDGVRFEVLYPAARDSAAARRVNDLSCVLRVTAGTHRMLLTGDIERPAELALAQRGGIGSQALLAPHHGSRTSSSAEFLAAVQPELVVIPVGYRSRFGHPHRDVLARYGALGARIRRTDLDGAVTVRLGGAGLRVETERAARSRYWNTTLPPA
ncbi:MAG: DNA internalization-related competence protein ComEC/Rec2 [Betaproteobacteria bacterium]|nr:DNA internalization-related competence protein ComEC/Rec2 [Betaproteobacteria bacterium]